MRLSRLKSWYARRSANHRAKSTDSRPSASRYRRSIARSYGNLSGGSGGQHPVNSCITHLRSTQRHLTCSSAYSYYTPYIRSRLSRSRMSSKSCPHRLTGASRSR